MNVEGRVMGTGRVLGVFRKPEPDASSIRKWPQSFIEVESGGVRGDYHYRPVDPDTLRRRALTIVSRELIEWIHRELDLVLQPGDLGENILVEGLGDLTDVAAGDRFVFDGGPILVITGPNTPCQKLNRYHPELMRRLVGRRGLTAGVIRSGSIRPGMVFTWCR